MRPRGRMVAGRGAEHRARTGRMRPDGAQGSRPGCGFGRACALARVQRFPWSARVVRTHPAAARADGRPAQPSGGRGGESRCDPGVAGGRTAPRDDPVVGRPDRGVAAELRAVSRRADDRGDECGRARIERGRQPRVRQGGGGAAPDGVRRVSHPGRVARRGRAGERFSVLVLRGEGWSVCGCSLPVSGRQRGTRRGRHAVSPVSDPHVRRAAHRVHRGGDAHDADDRVALGCCRRAVPGRGDHRQPLRRRGARAGRRGDRGGDPRGGRDRGRLERPGVSRRAGTCVPDRRSPELGGRSGVLGAHAPGVQLRAGCARQSRAAHRAGLRAGACRVGAGRGDRPGHA